MPEREGLEQRIEAAESDLQRLQRESLLTPDPIRLQQLPAEIQSSLRRLFELRKQRDTLARGGPQLELHTPSTTATAERAKVFISFHRRDRRWFDRLGKHLEPLLSRGLVDAWNEARVKPEAPWREELEQAIRSAQVAVVLVSADYLASALAIQEEIPLLLDEAGRGDLVVLPVIVSPSAYARSPLARFRSANSPSSPLDSVSRIEQEKILSNLANSIERYLCDGAAR